MDFWTVKKYFRRYFSVVFGSSNQVLLFPVHKKYKKQELCKVETNRRVCVQSSFLITISICFPYHTTPGWSTGESTATALSPAQGCLLSTKEDKISLLKCSLELCCLLTLLMGTVGVVGYAQSMSQLSSTFCSDHISACPQQAYP